MTIPHEPSPTTIAPAFVPTCLTCRYDLSTLPDGRCPECGQPFTLIDLIDRHAKARRFDGRALALTIGWTLLWCFVAFTLSAMIGEASLKPIILACAWMSLAWVFRRELARTRGRTFVFTLLPAAFLVVGASDAGFTNAHPRGVHFLPVMLPACFAAISLAWRVVPARRSSSLVAACSGILLGAGVTITYLARKALAQGRTWSVWPDLRSWQPYPNYPFTNSEAGAIGIALAVIGLMLCVASSTKMPSADR